jgi:membrane protease YdiL (CAAX protease family)
MSMSEVVPPPVQSPIATGITYRRVFFNESELRAGWRLLLFIALLFVIGAAAAWLTSGLIPPLKGELGPGQILANELRRFFVVFAATYVMARVERRSIGDYGLPAREMFGKLFWSGALWGFVMVSAIIALLAVTSSYSMGGVALTAAAMVRFGLAWAIAFLTVGFLEEFAFRGYIQFALTSGLGFWPAAVVTCALFAWVHHGNPGETWVGLLNIVLIAGFICLALRRTGSLWFPIGWHMAFDWGESFFYSVPDSGTHVVGHLFDATIQGNKWLSGGTVGPEASVFNVLVTVAGLMLFTRLYPVARYPRIGSRPGSSAPLAASPGLPHPAA